MNVEAQIEDAQRQLRQKDSQQRFGAGKRGQSSNSSVLIAWASSLQVLGGRGKPGRGVKESLEVC